MIQIKKTILTLVALLAVTTGAWADEITVTWSSGDTYENNNSKDGVTLSGDIVRYYDSEWQLAYEEEKGTFTTELGNFTNIEINGGYIDGFSGEGWSGWTWTGNAAAVPFEGFLTDGNGRKPWTITFTIEPASSEPEPEPGAASAVEVDWNKTSKTGTFTMLGGNVELEPEYYPQAALTAAPTAINDVPATTDGAIVKPGTVKNIGETTTAQGTVMYYVSPTALDDAALLALAADAWTADVPTAESFTAAGQAYVYYYVRGNDSDTDDEIFSDGDILSANALTVTIAAAPTYAVTFADDLAEPDKWTASPNADVTKGQPVTVTYTGTKKVLGVKAEKAAPAGTDLSTINAEYTASNGETLTGTLASNVKISIADGATVTLNNVTINGVNDSNYDWAGITCLGDATIILSGTNTVNGFYQDYPGIQAAAGKTLIINGTGSLTASTYGWSAGIGGGKGVACGNIEIQDGTITATGGQFGAGIGGGNNASCGNITISGGTVTATGGERGAGIGGGRRALDDVSCGNILISGGTVTATGGESAAGIGGGRGNNNKYLSNCGTITITTGVTKVTATKGEYAPNSIGAGEYGTCGTVTIGGNVGAITTSPYTYPAAD